MFFIWPLSLTKFQCLNDPIICRKLGDFWREDLKMLEVFQTWHHCHREDFNRQYFLKKSLILLNVICQLKTRFLVLISSL